LVERNAIKTITKSGIMLPEKSSGEVLQTAVAVGLIRLYSKGGQSQPVSVQAGDSVLLPEH
jgi:co-chaperonin GroES (HSP10)